MDKPIENADELEKLLLVRKIRSMRTKEPSDEIVRRAKEIRQNRTCRHCRWRRDGVDICVLPRCLREMHKTQKEKKEKMRLIDADELPVQRLQRQIEKLNADIENMAENIRAAYKQRDELREALDNVTVERDVLLVLLKHYAGCWECEVRDKEKCAVPFFKDECDKWTWRGKQEGSTQ